MPAPQPACAPTGYRRDCGITERAAQRIVSDLVEAGYVSRQREGRRNRYVLNLSVPMRHPSQVDHEIGELVDVLRLDDSSDSEAAG